MKRKLKAASGKVTQIQEASDLYKDDEREDDADIDIYGAGDAPQGEPDLDSRDLDNEDDEIVGVDDLDDVDVSDDDEAVDGQTVDPEEAEGEDDAEAVLSQLKDLIADLEDLVGGEGDADLEDEELPPSDDEVEDEVEEAAEEDEEEGEELDEEADPSAWNGSMQTLKAPAGQDGSEKVGIDNPTIAKGSKKAKALPKGKKPSGEEGNEDYTAVLGASDKAAKAASKTSLPKAKAVLDVVQKMLASDTKTIEALYKSGTKLKAMEALDFDMSDEVASLAESEALSDEGKAIAADIVEAAVRSRVEQVIDIVEANYVLEAAASIKEDQDALIERLDNYFGYMAESYFEENRVALVEGAKGEISDSFMEALRGVFVEHYAEVPKGKENVVERLEAKLAESNAKVKEVTKKAIGFRNKARELRKESLITKASEGLSLNEAARFAKIAEDVDYTGNNEKFVDTLNSLKEAHFRKSIKNPAEQEFEALAEQTNDNKNSTAMDSYLAAVKRTT